MSLISKMVQRVLLIVVILTLLAACGPTGVQQSELREIRLPMGFIPNIQYAPFYVAAERGYFEEEGISVDFDYSTETDGVALVGSGELELSLASGEQVLLAREQGAPVVYVFAWWQDFPVAVAALDDKGLESPEDLASMEVGIPGRFGASYIGLIALLRAGGLTVDDVQLDSIGFNQVEALATGQDDAVVVYANNEPIQLRAQGYEIDVLRVSDHVELASNGLITNERTIQENPELVQGMIQAVLKGVQDTIEDPEAAYQISTGYVEGLDEADKATQMQVLETSIQFWEAERLGFSEPEAWQNMQQVLLAMDLLSDPVEVEQAFTNQFIPGP
ncbi:MAG: ABC transporter substrate-binding protein [Anaerolineales bacterium]